MSPIGVVFDDKEKAVRFLEQKMLERARELSKPYREGAEATDLSQLEKVVASKLSQLKEKNSVVLFGSTFWMSESKGG